MKTSSRSEYLNMRCPVGPKKLLARLRVQGEAPLVIQPDNLIEFSCGDCARSLKRTGRYDGQRFRCLHRFNFVGELIETEIVFLDGTGSEV